MPTKKKAKKRAASLPPVTPPAYGVTYATSRAVSEEEALALIAKGWVLTQHDDKAVVVACTHDVLKED